MFIISSEYSIASLATSVQGLKEADAAYKKDFVKGLILGSTNLVTTNNSTSVMSSLTSFAKMDLSSLLNGAAEKTEKVTENAAKDVLTNIMSSATKEAQKTDLSQIQNAAEIASSVSGILKLFK